MQWKENGVLRILNKVFLSEFLVGYADRHTPDEGRILQRPKCCDANNKSEKNSSIVNNVSNKIVLSFFRLYTLSFFLFFLSFLRLYTLSFACTLFFIFFLLYTLCSRLIYFDCTFFLSLLFSFCLSFFRLYNFLSFLLYFFLLAVHSFVLLPLILSSSINYTSCCS